ncbi:hypothetical protein GSI_12235 [Ganoderma sinense ZZ0214-1]|uniref:beta-glucosidase n=1 Tax=Ganoderma sinense ZZ0214-1 TaxID=1077348 RepID=A0A2G8RYB8_9APHY|nr:hypothetical protein GSI_12235 [Ganoderma sinense ZZ0214-1]
MALIRLSALWALLLLVISSGALLPEVSSVMSINGVSAQSTSRPTLSASSAIANATSITSVTAAAESLTATSDIPPTETTHPRRPVPASYPTSARPGQKRKPRPTTLEQKVSASTGIGSIGNRCVGNIAAIGDDWPGLCFEDGPVGVRSTDFVTAFPAGINAAATWNRTLIRARGKAIGQEFKGKGVNVGLGPMMNIARIPQAGRNWEGFGADPFLSGEAVYETVLGWQEGGAQVCAKHYINKTEHEIYVHPFMRAVQAGVASVMCSYNLINDTFACENDRTLNQILKSELGFQGFVVSDWAAQRSTLSAVAGLDMSMPGDIIPGSGTSFFGANLTTFVENGTIAEARLDDMVERIVAAWYLLGQDDNHPEMNFNQASPYDPATNQHVDVQGDHFKIVREIGAASAVLLKNVGNDSGPSLRGPNGYPSNAGDDGTLAMGWGSGTASFPYLIAPLEAIQARAREDRSSVSWFLSNWDSAGAANAARGQDVALVFANADSGEGAIIVGESIPPELQGMVLVDGQAGDRANLTLWGNADALISAVAAVNPNTVVVVHSVGPVIVEAWIENPNVTAVLWAGLPGQESGNSLVDVLYGAVNPSGHLPYTIAKDPADYPAQLVTAPANVTEPTGWLPLLVFIIEYTEGLNIDYRGFSDVLLEPGESKAVTITLSRYDLSIWDSGAQGWRKPEGIFTFSVGASSLDFRLNGTIPI